MHLECLVEEPPRRQPTARLGIQSDGQDGRSSAFVNLQLHVAAPAALQRGGDADVNAAHSTEQSLLKLVPRGVRGPRALWQLTSCHAVCVVALQGLEYERPTARAPQTQLDLDA